MHQTIHCFILDHPLFLYKVNKVSHIVECLSSICLSQNLVSTARIHGPNLPCVNSPGWWCDGVGYVFSAKFSFLNTNQTWLKRHSHSIVADHVHPFMATVYHLLMGTSSRIMHHVTKKKSSQTGFMTSSGAFSGLSHRQILIQQNTLGMWQNG